MDFKFVQPSILLFLVVVIVHINGCSVSKDTENHATALFDGKSFTGWEGNMDMFRIEDGAVVAGTLDTFIPRNEFLCTEVMVENFELRLKAKMQGPGDNAGIQFRSRRIPDHHEVTGYQCDMGSDPSGKIWGYLYDESRRKRFLATPDSDALLNVLIVDDWNDFVIRAEGSRIQIWLNGQQTVDFTEEDDSVFRNGVICLQIHGGKPAEAWYKDVYLVKL
ncbi:MAG: DUF1080 domain-containing protein [Saprospiraceae bacterium]|nr:DUF1080 domain-containing protein [Saprospiraceae bacterium]